MIVEYQLQILLQLSQLIAFSGTVRYEDFAREEFEKFLFSCKSSSLVVVFQEVCFHECVPCDRHGLMNDRQVMAAMLESNRPSYFYVGGGGPRKTEKNKEKIARNARLCTYA